MSTVIRIISMVIAGGAFLVAQHAHAPAPVAEKPVALIPYLGAHTHTIATKNADAQKFFDQGLNLLYGFNRYEALRSFRKAAELDPSAPMPLWGIAMTLGPHINMDMDMDVDTTKGCEVLTKAQQLKSSAYERAYVEAAAIRCTADEDRYIEAARGLSEQFPDDLDAAAFYADSLMTRVRWKWWNADGTPALGMASGVQILEAVMRRNPNHPGANHYYIHAVEMSPSPERAIPSAQRLMGIMPNAGHMVHMPGHIWLILGDWQTAVDVNERAAQADREYFAKTGVQSGYLGYYIHNLHFVAYARGMQGRAADAIQAADTMVREATPAVDAMPEMLDSFIAYTLFNRVRFGRWDELLEMQQPNPKLLATTALWHWSRAIAAGAKGDGTSASRETGAFHASAAKVPAQWPWLNNKAVDVLAVADAILQARLASGDAAIAQWQRAVDLQDKLAYEEPPPWFMPLRESLGGALLRAGRAGEAEVVFREGVKRSARNGRMLFGLMKSLDAQNKVEAALLVRREFEREWKKADVVLRIEDL